MDGLPKTEGSENESVSVAKKNQVPLIVFVRSPAGTTAENIFIWILEATR